MSTQLLSRDFKGIWIPKEIWLNPNLSMSAKALWAEIDSLYCEEKGGCYATEEYLSEFLGIQRRRFYEIIKELTDSGFLEKVFCDGRTTVRKALIPLSGAQQQCTKVHSRSAEKCTPPVHKTALPSYIENKVESKEQQQQQNVVVVDEKVRKFSKDDAYFVANKCGKDWTSAEIESAYLSFTKSKSVISDPVEYLAGIIKKQRKTKEFKETSCQKTPLQTQNTTLRKSSAIDKQALSEKDIEGHPSQTSSLMDMIKKSVTS